MWIEMVEKRDYENSSKLTGLRVSFDKRIEKERTIEIKKFADRSNKMAELYNG